MVGKKGKSGRKKQFNDEYHRVARKLALEYYYNHHKARAKAMKEYHKKNKHIMQYAKKHGLSIPEARRQLEERRRKEK